MCIYERFSARYGGHKAKHLSPPRERWATKWWSNSERVQCCQASARGASRRKMRAAVGGLMGVRGRAPTAPPARKRNEGRGGGLPLRRPKAPPPRKRATGARRAGTTAGARQGGSWTGQLDARRETSTAFPPRRAAACRRLAAARVQCTNSCRWRGCAPEQVAKPRSPR